MPLYRMGIHVPAEGRMRYAAEFDACDDRAAAGWARTLMSLRGEDGDVGQLLRWDAEVIDWAPLGEVTR